MQKSVSILVYLQTSYTEFISHICPGFIQIQTGNVKRCLAKRQLLPEPRIINIGNTKYEKNIIKIHMNTSMNPWEY